jgi:tyrosine-specific transport protein
MSIGAGLLALPVATAAAGFYHSSLLLIVIWLLMTMGALCILEVSLWLPEDSNLVSMARHTLGKPGEIITWIGYLMLLYTLLCVFISGGTDLLNSIWQSMKLPAISWLSSTLFVLIFGTIVWHGIKLIDHTNRMLMSAKMLTYLALIILLIPHVNAKLLPSGPSSALVGAILPAIFSFGYAIITPSLRSYLNSNIKQLRFVVLVGSSIPLVCYIIWNYAVQGTLSQSKLVAIDKSGQVVSQLNQGLSALGNPWVTTIIHAFTTICILTSFLAVSLSLSDFIADGLKRKKEGKNKKIIYSLTFLPPLIIILFQPYLYMKAISYAGLLCVLILMLLPAAMAWNGRYHKKISNRQYQAPGGKIGLAAMLIISAALFIFTLIK